MEFGRVTTEALKTVDFSLPPEPSENRFVLSGNPVKYPAVYVGCAKWGRKEWIGKIYPQGTKEKDFLEHYVKHYNSIELNATHYQIYNRDVITKWRKKAEGRKFKFCPKFPQIISHHSGFKNVGAATDSFLDGIMGFGENLGPVFLQISEYYSPERRQPLFDYLASLPKGIQFFLEIRHPKWFADAVMRKELLDTLRSLHIGAVITDTAGRRDAAHMELTVPKTFIRFVGNSLHPTDYMRIDDWLKRIYFWLDQGMEELYFFMHMHDEAYSPELTVYLVDKLNEQTGLQLQKPKFIQHTLF